MIIIFHDECSAFFSTCPCHVLFNNPLLKLTFNFAEQLKINVQTSKTRPCDLHCVIVVLSSVSLVVMVLVIVCLFVGKRYPCSGRVAGTQYKPGLIGTPDGLLNTVPSEYVDDGFMLQRIKSEVSYRYRVMISAIQANGCNSLHYWLAYFCKMIEIWRYQQL